ncbi:MAG: phosphoribosylformylglycinamidine cyclo-ligase, partial [Proteobacteria bacterium]|nr:phosphoribosylformylglycinamidine cyclo-ligase [Pseudomonadota bacterium]
EMYRTFNCGIGMTVILDAGTAEQALSILERAGESAQVIGSVRDGMDGVRID